MSSASNASASGGGQEDLIWSCLPPLPEKMSFDPKADLTLRVGTDPTFSFAVCSRDLERVSRVWDRMLNGYFKESRARRQPEDDSEWIIALPEDEPRAMAVVLEIVHGRFARVPTYDWAKGNGKECWCLHVDDLYGITWVLEKYDMVHLARPWAHGWMMELMGIFEYQKDHYWDSECFWRQERAKGLWIAWTLGDDASFQAIAQAMLLEWRPPNQMYHENADLALQLDDLDVLEPLDLHDIIVEARPKILQALLDVIDKIITSLIRGQKWPCRKNKVHRSYGLCLSTMLGKAIQSLDKMCLWPLPKVEEIHIDVSALVRDLRTVRFTGYGGERHKCCLDEYLNAEIDQALAETLPSFLDVKGVREHFQAQAKKTGLSDGPRFEYWESPQEPAELTDGGKS